MWYLFLIVPGLVCLFLGVVFLLVSRSIRTKQEAGEQRFAGRAWARLAGTGSRVERSYDNRARTVYFGVYEFDTADGRQISSSSDFGYDRKQDVPGTDGKMVKVCYDPRNPTDFSLPEEQTTVLSVWPRFRRDGIVLTVLGAVFTLAAAAVLLGLFNPFPDA